MILGPVLLLVASCKADGTAPQPAQSYCHQESFENSRFTVCDNEGGQLRLFAAGKDEKALRSFAEVAAITDPDSIAFAMNAGMFNEQGQPIGLARTESGQKRSVNLRDGPGNFHLKPNGVFMVTCGAAHAIFPSDSMPVFRCAPRLATQSGPMLVIAGKLHPKFEHDGPSRLIRNGVGVRAGKAVFVITDDPVSLGKFARFFRDGLKTPDALYFDGSVSSLWDPANGRLDSHSLLGPIIVALKPAASKPDREGPARL
jgi:uncharacterized protein YigE (DUF2233 family)